MNARPGPTVGAEEHSPEPEPALSFCNPTASHSWKKLPPKLSSPDNFVILTQAIQASTWFPVSKIPPTVPLARREPRDASNEEIWV